MSITRPHEDRLGTGGASATEVLTRSGTGIASWEEPGAHGAANHTNITRSLYLRGKDAGLDSGTAAVIGTTPNIIAVLALADAATEGGYWTFGLPSDWASGDLTAQIIWSPGATDATPHTVRWTMTARMIRDALAEFDAPVTTTFTGASAARTQDTTVFDTVTAMGLSPVAGDLCRLEIERIGADAADTYVGVVNLIGVIVSYTANQ